MSDIIEPGLVVLDADLGPEKSGVIKALAARVAFVVSRTVGLPQIGDDIGNWTEALGYPALAAEGVVAVVSAMTLVRARRHPTPVVPSVGASAR